LGKRISEEIKKQIPILYKELGNKTQVAKQLGISVSTVTKYLNLIEAAPQERKPKTIITEDLIKKINEKYTECKNMS
jgi:DNA invertase Pin-like site-specific DNA recombinase